MVHTVENIGHDIVQTAENIGHDIVQTVDNVGEDIVHGDIAHIGQDLLQGGENIGSDLVRRGPRRRRCCRRSRSACGGHSACRRGPGAVCH